MVLHLYRHYRGSDYFKIQKTYRRHISHYLPGLILSLFCAVLALQISWVDFSGTQYLLLFYLLIVFALLIMVAYIDHKLYLIPNVLVLILAVMLILMLSFMAIATQNELTESVTASVLHVLSPALFRSLGAYTCLRLLIYFLSYGSKRAGLGLGDINLLSVLALWFQVYYYLCLITLACLMGLVYIFIHNRYFSDADPLRVIAFGPWIVGASLFILQLSVLEQI